MIHLLDTHVLLWWLAGGERLSKGQRRAVRRASADEPLFVSDMTLWEVAMLHALGRIKLDLTLRDWLERAVAPPLVHLQHITPAIAAEVAALPPTFHRDPVDRVLVATARILGATLVTSDQRIRASGLIRTLA